MSGLKVQVPYCLVPQNSGIVGAIFSIQKNDFSMRPLGSLLQGCKNFMSSVDYVSHVHILREANMTANSLSKMSINHEKGVISNYLPRAT